VHYDELLSSIGSVTSAAQTAAARSINLVLTVRNWLVGAYIVEFEQQGEDRAAYGSRLLETLADDLKRRGVQGFSLANLKNFRQLALTYPAVAGPAILAALLAEAGGAGRLGHIRQTASSELVAGGDGPFPVLVARARDNPVLPWQDGAYYRRLFANLSWSHLLRLTRLDDPLKRAFYELECLRAGWSERELRRQIESLLYERTGLSRDREAVLAAAADGQSFERPEILLRDPYVFEFLGIEARATFSEAELEQALIDHLEAFMRELGRDFCFIGRQQRIVVGGEYYYIDLLFFHRRLRCLVAIDLKLGEFRHEHAGQMNFYLNYLKAEDTYEGENPPVGILLFAEKDDTVVRYATAGIDNQLFVSRYRVALPSEEELRRWLTHERQFLEGALEQRALSGRENLK